MNSTRSSTQLSLFFNNTELSPSHILKSLGLSFTQKLNWKFNIFLLLNQLPLCQVFCIVFSHFSPHQLLTVYRGLVRPCMEYACHVCWGGSTHTALLDRVESKAFRLIRSPLLIIYLLPLNFRRSVASLSIFYCYFHANCSSELAEERRLAGFFFPFLLCP